MNPGELGAHAWIFFTSISLVVLALVVEWPLVWFYASRAPVRATRSDPLVTLATGCFVVLVTGAGIGSALLPPPPLAVFGIVLAASGLALRAWAIHALGRSFGLTLGVRSSHRLITSGPYRYIRHPAYTGALALLLGLALTVCIWQALLGIGLLTAAVRLRVRKEDAILRRAFGELFAAYEASVPPFLPRPLPRRPRGQRTLLANEGGE
jgi:protein-S-isoprenylcysteine O-methyltransferase